MSDPGIDSYCPGRGDLWSSEELWNICYWDLPGSFAQCEKRIAGLSSKDNPTLQDKYDVAFFRSNLAGDLVLDEPKRAYDMYVESRDELRQLAEEYPRSFDVLETLAAIENDDSRRFALHWQMMEVAPSCTNALFWLVYDIEGSYDWDQDPNEYTHKRTSERIEHRTKLLLHGYRHGPSKKERMRYALLRFHELRNNRNKSRANEFRQSVIDDLGLNELVLNNRTRTENLELICHVWAFGMGFAPLCADAIERLYESDLKRSDRPRDDVLRATRRLLHEISERLEHPDPQRLVLFTDGLPGVRYQYGTEVFNTVNRLQNAFLQIPQELRNTRLDNIQKNLNELMEKLVRLEQARSTQQPFQHEVNPHVLIESRNVQTQ